jgi:hypothetical protein
VDQLGLLTDQAQEKGKMVDNAPPAVPSAK